MVLKHIWLLSIHNKSDGENITQKNIREILANIEPCLWRHLQTYIFSDSTVILHTHVPSLIPTYHACTPCAHLAQACTRSYCSCCVRVCLLASVHFSIRSVRTINNSHQYSGSYLQAVKECEWKMRNAVASTDDIELLQLATDIMFELSWRDTMRRLEIKFKSCTILHRDRKRQRIEPYGRYDCLLHTY